MKPTLTIIFAYWCLTPFLISQEQPVFELSHLDTSEVRTSLPTHSETILSFKLAGTSMENTLEAGNWKVEEAIDSSGRKLRLLEPARGVFRPLQHHGDHSRLELKLSVANRKATMITSLKGSVGVNLFRRQIVILNLKNTMNQTIENPLFAAHDFTVQIIDPQHAYPGYSNPADIESLRTRAVAIRVEGDIDKVDSFQLVGPDGNTIPSRPAGFGAGRSRVMARMADTPIPDGTTAHLLIPIDPQEIRIPFSFSNIPLP